MQVYHALRFDKSERDHRDYAKRHGKGDGEPLVLDPKAVRRAAIVKVHALRQRVQGALRLADPIVQKPYSNMRTHSIVERSVKRSEQERREWQQGDEYGRRELVGRVERERKDWVVTSTNNSLQGPHAKVAHHRIVQKMFMDCFLHIQFST